MSPVGASGPNVPPPARVPADEVPIRPMRRALLAGCTLALLVAGCGGSNKEAATTTTATATTTATTTTAGAPSLPTLAFAYPGSDALSYKDIGVVLRRAG